MGELIFANSQGSFLELEHGLIMLLLLYGLLSIQRRKDFKFIVLVIISGLLLSLFTPIHDIDIFWPLISLIVVPPLVWQASVSITRSGPIRHLPSLVIWLVLAVLVTFILMAIGRIPLATSFLLSTLALTLVWKIRERSVDLSYLSTIGLVTLTTLLVEIDLAVVNVKDIIGGFLSGTSIGLALGALGIWLFMKINQEKWKTPFFYLWTYIVFSIGIFLDTSPIAITLASTIVISIYGKYKRIWTKERDISVPSNSSFFIYLFSLIWIGLGWQAHTSIESINFLSIFLSLLVIAIGILFVRKYAPITSENRWLKLFLQETSIFLFLISTILLWPEDAFLTALEVEIALGTAIFLIVLLRYWTKPIFEFFGVKLNWPKN